MGYGRNSGPPTWFVILVGIAIVFGLYYMWLGVRNFMATGMTVVESTRAAIELYTETAVRVEALETSAPTSLPTQTPVPSCQDFIVDVPSAIIRSLPTTNSEIVNTVSQGEVVCVIGREADTDWYLIDENPLTRRLDPAYMHKDIIQALNPTLTPSLTFTPAPTVTNTPSFTPSQTPPITDTPTRDPNATSTPTLTPSPTETPPSANL